MVCEKNIKAYACVNKKYEVRCRSTSGGVFYELASVVINKGGEVCAARFDDDFQVRHSFCRTEEQLYNFLGSKYVPSILDGVYQKIREKLEEDKLIMFVGTPCQVNALSSYLKKNYNNLILVDFICHGVPEKKVWNLYLQCLQKKGRIKAISFRSKEQGWQKYSFKVEYEDGKVFMQDRYNNAYLQGFVHDLYLRGVCYSCKNRGFNRKSDITLGDFWGVDRQVPDAYDDKGTSAVIINTQKGDTLFEKIISKIEVYPVNLIQITRGNISYYENVTPHKNREKFMNGLNNKKNVERWIWINLKGSFIERVVGKIRRTLS